jgi:hypothetical protein
VSLCINIGGVKAIFEINKIYKYLLLSDTSDKAVADLQIRVPVFADNKISWTDPISDKYSLSRYLPMSVTRLSI